MDALAPDNNEAEVDNKVRCDGNKVICDSRLLAISLS
jgi:hypothetical protein